MAHKSHLQLNKSHENCGHKGQGKFCHLCKQLEQKQLIRKENGKYIRGN